MARKPTMWMLIGVPGSGKSTWVENQIEDLEGNVFIASTDNYIEYIAKSSWKTYNDVFKDNIKEAEKNMYVGVMNAVENDQDIIWDQTNITFKSRAKKLIMIPDHYTKIAVVFPTPEEEELQRRLASRPGKTIPEHILGGMIEMMEYPMMAEGFHSIIEFDEGMFYV